MAVGIAGDPDQLEETADLIALAGACLVSDADDVRDHARRVLGGWLGTAADAFQVHTTAAADDVDRVAAAARDMPAPLRNYADELRAAQRHWGHAQAAHHSAARRRADAVARGRAAGDDDAAQEAADDAEDADRLLAQAADAMRRARQRALDANNAAAARLSAILARVETITPAHATPGRVSTHTRSIDLPGSGPLAAGAAVAAADGPFPVLDVVGVGIVIYGTYVGGRLITEHPSTIIPPRLDDLDLHGPHQAKRRREADIYGAKEWQEAQREAARIKGDYLREEKRSGVGARAGRSGGHGEPMKRAAQRLRERANDKTENPALREALRKEAERLRQKGKGTSHPGGRQR